MRSASVLWWSGVLCLVAAPLSTGAADPELTLPDAVRQALVSNLDLKSQEQALASDRENIGIARAALLPQIILGGQGQILEDDRSDDSRGTVTRRSVTVDAGLAQLIYGENERASFEVEQYQYAARIQQFEAVRLDVAEQAATSFLELDRERALLDVQDQNRSITLENIETARARLAAGYSSETEILRWKSQLAANESDLAATRAQILARRFELNRLRNRPREEPIALRTASVEDYGFVYARPTIARAIARPEADRRLRDALVRVGLERSPVLAEADQAIAAAERQLTANRRAFWLPSLSLVAGVNHLAARSSSDDDFDETEWGVGAKLAFPLLQGGSKFATERQTREYLASLRSKRRADVVSLSEAIRSSFARASGAFAVLGFREDQATVAQRYFELTNESYVLGVASLVRLLDAQTQRLAAERALTLARYDLLTALVSAEREIALFPFLEPAADVTNLLEQLEQQVLAGS